ncbi:MAG: N-acetyltransferase [Chloroflexi bacterium]|nr:MAG: N-acetyltransferase [Chloroflexota bacterium]MBL1197231.1 N-acetyltransferase [Chloroflexota bacterium]NOH14525.1 GNAT family N-acetyltransferase [Chloroflexota bacterium]
MVKLAGRILTLRDIMKSDLQALGDWLHPEQEWHKTDGPYYPRSSEEEIAKKINNWEQAIIENSWPDLRQRLVVVDSHEDEVIGMVSRYWISEETNWTAIGISIFDPKNWGKGYGYEALGLWCQYLFDNEPKFVRLDLRTWSGNIGMMKVAKNLGFTKEAVFRMARIVEGQYYDGVGYGILRKEWEERYPGSFSASLQ